MNGVVFQTSVRMITTYEPKTSVSGEASAGTSGRPPQMPVSGVNA
jgi:hypothetical protein